VAFVFDVGSLRIYFPEWLFWIGVVLLILGALTTLIAVLQLNLHLSPFPSPLPGSKLIVTGVYKFIRHPIYTGIITVFFGYAIIADSGYKLLVALILTVLFYFKSKYEEKRLIDLFPDYLEYKKKSGRFFPRL
jgi:protein-S-isoprenylcysteine O-methyltransferase Ste14